MLYKPSSHINVMLQFEFECGYREEYLHIHPPGWPPPSKLDMLHYFHPFYRECRAYGRLKEVTKEELSVHCHGYLLLDTRLELQLQHFTRRPFNRYNEDKHEPIRALVKDYIDSETEFLPRMIPKMMRNVHAFHKVGIIINDIRGNNYLDGILFDLSRAKTVPHPELTQWFIEQALEIQLISETPTIDYHNFDYMVDLWNDFHTNQHIWNRFLPNIQYSKKLRGSRDQLQKRIRRQQRIVYHHAELYNWRRS